MAKKSRTVLGVDLDALSPPDPVIFEGVLGTVPDVKIEEAVDILVDRLGKLIEQHVLQDRSKDPVMRAQAINASHEVIKDIKKEVKQSVMTIVSEKLLSYSRN